jgi:hypothetical protein
MGFLAAALMMAGLIRLFVYADKVPPKAPRRIEYSEGLVLPAYFFDEETILDLMRQASED